MVRILTTSHASARHCNDLTGPVFGVTGSMRGPKPDRPALLCDFSLAVAVNRTCFCKQVSLEALLRGEGSRRQVWWMRRCLVTYYRRPQRTRGKQNEGPNGAPAAENANRCGNCGTRPVHSGN